METHLLEVDGTGTETAEQVRSQIFRGLRFNMTGTLLSLRYLLVTMSHATVIVIILTYWIAANVQRHGSEAYMIVHHVSQISHHVSEECPMYTRSIPISTRTLTEYGQNMKSVKTSPRRCESLSFTSWQQMLFSSCEKEASFGGWFRNYQCCQGENHKHTLLLFINKHKILHLGS